MAEFSLDMSKFTRAMKRSPEAVGRGAAIALGDIKNDWVRESRDLAPLDKSHLRKQIRGDVVNPGISGMVEVHANAGQNVSGKRFNYAYYIHEQDAGGRTLRLAGAEKKFLDAALERRRSEYQRWLEEEIKAELKKQGWWGRG